MLDQIRPHGLGRQFCLPDLQHTGERSIAGFDLKRNADRRAEAVVLFRLDMSHAKQLIRPFTKFPRPMQEGLAFRSKGSIGVVVWCGAKARVTQPPHRPTADPGLVLVRGPDRPDL